MNVISNSLRPPAGGLRLSGFFVLYACPLYPSADGVEGVEMTKIVFRLTYNLL